MKTIGVLFGGENSFPGALVAEINGRGADGVRAEFVTTGAVPLDRTPRYAVIVDRISHAVPFYRAFLKQAALCGTAVINDPFRAAADDKFFNYALARRLGVAVPATVLLPHKRVPASVTDRSLRNLEYPLDWESVFAAVGEHGFLKPIDGGGGRDVQEVRGRAEFFRAYDESRELCMVYQKAVDYTEYFRCYVVGQKKVRILAYDPRRPHAERYLQSPPRASKMLLKRIRKDAIGLCRALGYEFNSVEFGVERGVPYAIDFMNPVPDADPRTLGQESFDWVVKEVADLAIAKAKSAPRGRELRGNALLGGGGAREKAGKKKAQAARIRLKQK